MSLDPKRVDIREEGPALRGAERELTSSACRCFTFTVDL